MFVKSFTFFDRKRRKADLSKTISELLSNPNNGVGLQLQVDGSNIDISIECRINNDSQQEWHNVGAISLLDYKIYPTITKAGEYQISMDGINYCRIIDNGSGDDLAVYGNLTA